MFESSRADTVTWNIGTYQDVDGTRLDTGIRVWHIPENVHADSKYHSDHVV